MEIYYTNLGKIERKEASWRNEIAVKTEEIGNLVKVLSAKQKSAMQAIGQLARSSDRKSKPSQQPYGRMSLNML